MIKSVCKYLMILAIVSLLFSCNTSLDNVYENNFYRLTLNELNGAIESIEKNGKNMIAEDNAEMPLFEICLLDKAQGGKVIRANSDQATKCEISQSKDKITIAYSQFEGIDISAFVTVDVSKESPFMNWNIEVDNNTPYLIDYIDFPNVVVPNDLIGNGGDSRIFWPAQEGVVVEDINVRERGMRKYRPIEYPNISILSITFDGRKYQSSYNTSSSR